MRSQINPSWQGIKHPVATTGAHERTTVAGRSSKISRGALFQSEGGIDLANLTEAIAAAIAFCVTFDEGELIDEESGFNADHLMLLIEWASTCGDAVEPDD
jgi:hypothetical protein